MHSTITRLHQQVGRLVRQPILARIFRRVVLDHERPRDVYWYAAPRLHRWVRYVMPGYVDPPIRPFKLVSVDPDRIIQFSRRAYPPWKDKWQSFGRVLDGDWDCTDSPQIRAHDGPERSYYLADRFTESAVHEVLEAHFVDGVPWHETDFIREMLRHARDEEYDRSCWHMCRTPAEVLHRCRFLDRLYDDMRERGCLSARQLNAEAGRRRPFSAVMKDEIIVDIGRTGELLFVEGRHRLSLAKILGLERIPVAIAVRHAKWMDRRTERLERASSPVDVPEAVHPDLRYALRTELNDVSS